MSRCRSLWSVGKVALGLPVLLLAGLVACGKANGAEQGSEVRLTGEDVASALRISIADAVIDYVNGAKHARIAVEWGLLPVDDLLKGDAAREWVIPETMRLSNALLSEGSWPRRLPEPLAQAIYQDLGAPPPPDHSVTAETLRQWNEKFLQDWLANPDSEKAKFARGHLQPRQYYALLCDHNLLHFLLASNGIGFYIDADSQQPVSGLPHVGGEGITWIIRQYPFLEDKEAGIWIYRYSVSARLAPFDIYLSNTTQEKIALSAVVSLRPSKATVGLSATRLYLGNFDVELSAARADQLGKIDGGGALTRVNGILDLFRSPELGTVIGKGLFGGSADTQVVTGLLAARDRVSGLVGANVDLSRAGPGWQPGFLFGVSPKGEDALYLGPSLRRSAVLASLGAVVRSEAEDTDEANRRLRGEWGGVLSVDLGRLFGGREVLEKVGVPQAEVGGNWGVSGDAMGRGLGYLTLSMSYQDPRDPVLEATQITDAEGKAVEPKSAHILRLTSGERRFFLPAGKYRLTVPAQRQLLDHALPVLTAGPAGGPAVVEIDILWEKATDLDYALKVVP
jgi:hypothetical protein